MLHPNVLENIRKSQNDQLDLGRYSSRLTIDDLVAIVNLLKEKKNINSLVLCENELSDDHLEALQELSETGIKKLDLSTNNITEKGAKILADLSSLKALSLSGNRIKDEGFQSLLKLPNLKELDVYNNDITADSCSAVLQNTTLCELSIGDESLSEEDINQLLTHVSRNAQNKKEKYQRGFFKKKASTEISGKENVENLIENTEKTLFQSVDNLEILIALLPKERQQETIQSCQKKLRQLLDHISNLEEESSLNKKNP